MNRRTFLKTTLAAALTALTHHFIEQGEETEAAAPTVPAPPTPPASGLMTIPFAVGRPRDKRVFVPIVARE